MLTRSREQDKEATVYVGNLDERVTDDIVWELMINVGRVQKVHLPKDRVTMSLQGYGFVTFATEEDAEYAVRIMNQVKLWGKPIRVKKASADKSKQEGIGAELFIGNLDPMVDERSLHMTFVRFGPLAANPKVRLHCLRGDTLLISNRYNVTRATCPRALASSHSQRLKQQMKRSST